VDWSRLRGPPTQALFFSFSAGRQTGLGSGVARVLSWNRSEGEIHVTEDEPTADGRRNRSWDGDSGKMVKTRRQKPGYLGESAVVSGLT
jgi:hypothetical protein